MNLVLSLLDVRPNPGGPVSIGILSVVVLLIVGFVILAAGGLVLVLWYRKRKMRTVEIIRIDAAPAIAGAAAQPKNPNQP